MAKRPANFFKLIATLIFSLFLNYHTICYAKTYIIGVEDTKYYPHFTTNGSVYVGFGRDVLDMFAEYESIEFKYYPFPVKRLFNEFTTGRVDFKYPDNPHWQVSMKKGKVYYYSDIVVGYISGAVVKPENLGRGIDSLRVLGVVRGFTPLPFMDRIKSGQIKPYENSNFPGVLKQTIEGRVDAAYVNLSVAKYQLRETLHQPSALILDSDLPHSVSSFHLSTFKHPELIQLFNQFRQDKQVEIKALMARYQVGIEGD